MDSGNFHRTGNIFTDITSLNPDVDIIPRQHKVSVINRRRSLVVPDNLGLSLPSNPTFNPSLASLAPQLTNAYLITRLVRCAPKCESRIYHCIQYLMGGQLWRLITPTLQCLCAPLPSRLYGIGMKHLTSVKWSDENKHEIRIKK